MRFPSRSAFSLFCTGLTVVSLATSARSQAVRGRLLDRDSGRPIAGALVGLQDTTGMVIQRRLTYESGGFLIQTARPGTFRFQVLRIGFHPWYSDYFELRAGERVTRSIRLRPQPIVLEELVAESDRCTTDPAEGTRTAQLLEEVRKAFLAAEATMRGGNFRFRIITFEHRRVQDEGGGGRGGGVSEARDSARALRVWPIDAAPAEDLDAYGFVRGFTLPDGPVYYGIDGSVIFSDVFLENHCFLVTADTKPDGGRIGLEFRPAGFLERPEVAGIIWINSKTLAPHALEYWYVGLPGWIPGRQAGGRFDFAEVPNGGWVIRRWWLRAPNPMVSPGQPSPRLFGYGLEGGEVTRVETLGGELLFDLQKLGAPLPELPGVSP